MPLHCLHCEDAPCVLVCPTEAMTKLGPGEPVICNGERCIGCSLCVLACPYGVLRLDRLGRKVLKCDLCMDRLGRGLEPACAEACPSLAIQFLPLEEIDRREGDDWRREFLIVYQGQVALASRGGG